jgi:hypothetical protein
VSGALPQFWRVAIMHREFVLSLQELRCWERAEAEEVGRRAIRAIRKGEIEPASND